MSVGKNAVHLLDLVRLFISVSLIDTDSVDPDLEGLILSAKVANGLLKSRRYGKASPVDEYLPIWRFDTPSVGECIVCRERGIMAGGAPLEPICGRAATTEVGHHIAEWDFE